MSFHVPIGVSPQQRTVLNHQSRKPLFDLVTKTAKVKCKKIDTNFYSLREVQMRELKKKYSTSSIIQTP